MIFESKLQLMDFKMVETDFQKLREIEALNYNFD